MPAPQAYYRLSSDHQELMRAAFNLCMSMHKTTEEYQALWDLCGNYEPTESEQGLVPIPDGYAEQ